MINPALNISSENFYHNLAVHAIAGQSIEDEVALDILTAQKIDLFDLVYAAWRIRRHYWGKDVTVHIINNVQNGLCSQDCSYCAQSKSSKAKIEIYPVKTDAEIMAEAEQAYRAGAFRHCLVFSGYTQTDKRIEHLADIVRQIKSRFPMQVCVSPGVITYEQALVLKKAGLDRLNHNLNTSEKFYPQICSTHTFQDRLNTVRAARRADLEVCSGIIVGLGEGPRDIITLARNLKEVGAASIPINFLIPIQGTAVHQPVDLTPKYCLRILCLFRIINPASEIRIAAGRELYLKDMQILGLMAANSLFLDGYLNVRGSQRLRTLQMIKDAGLSIRCDRSLDQILAQERKRETAMPNDTDIRLKTFDDLHPSGIDEKKG